MTVFEFFKKQYDEKVADGCGTTKVCKINPEIAKGSFKWVQIAARQFWGGAYQQKFEKCGITLAQLNEAREMGLVKYWYDASWTARQRGYVNYWSLTVKGLKTLYKEYEGQW